MIRKAKPPTKLPSRAQARKLLAKEFRQALIVPVDLSRVPKASCVGDSIDVEAEIGPRVAVRALVDTGCTMSAISPRALGQIGYKRIPPRGRKWVAAVADHFPIRGVANVFVEAKDGPELPMRIAVLDLRRLTNGSEDFQMLLGLDYLRAAMAKIDVAWSKIEFGCKMLPLRPVQVLPAGAAEPVLRSTCNAGSSLARVLVEMSVEDGCALERLIGRFYRAQLSCGLPADTMPAAVPEIDQDGRDGGP